MAPAARGGTPAADARLTKREMELIFNSIEACSSLETSLTQMNTEILEIKRLAAGRGEAVDYIVRTGLGHREAHARLASVEALARIAKKRALATLNEMVEFDDNYTVRRYAARAILGFGDKVALKKLLREIPDFEGELRKRLRTNNPKDPDKRKRFQELGRTVSRALNRFESLIKRMAANVDPHEQEKAKRELQRLTGDANRDSPKAWQKWWKQRKGIPPQLHRDVNRTADRTTMMTLIEIAAMIKSRQSLDGLIAALRHGDTSVKMAAATALGELARSKPKPKPKSSATPTSDACVDYLNTEESAKAIQALQKATHESNGWVKASAARGLSACKPKESIADFRRLLLDWAPTDRSARHAAMLARVRRAAVEGLHLAKSKESSPQLAALLLKPRGNRLLNWETTTVLGIHGTPVCLPGLAHFAARGELRETEHALAAIRSILSRAGRGTRFDLREVTEQQLKNLANGKDVPQAVAAVYQSNRRGYLRRPGYLGALSSASREARMLALALLAGDNWTPAVREFALTASSGREDVVLVRVACRAARRVCADSSIKAYLRNTPAGPDKLTVQKLTELRRAASETLIGLLQNTTLSPASATAVIDALPTVLPRSELALKNKALATMVSAIGRESLRTKRSDLGAALRQLSGEDYPDEPRFWQHWWKNHQRKGSPLSTEGGSRRRD
jgi:HEAT repeat protein